MYVTYVQMPEQISWLPLSCPFIVGVVSSYYRLAALALLPV